MRETKPAQEGINDVIISQIRAHPTPSSKIDAINTLISSWEYSRPSMQAFLYIQRSNVHNLAGNIDLKIKDLSKAIDVAPKTLSGTSCKHYALNKRSEIHKANRKYELALQDLNQSLAIASCDEQRAYTLNLRGRLYCTIGRTEDAIEDFNNVTALQLSGHKGIIESVKALINRGIVYKSMQHNDQAFQDYRQAIETLAEFPPEHQIKIAAIARYNKLAAQLGKAPYSPQEDDPAATVPPYTSGGAAWGQVISAVPAVPPTLPLSQMSNAAVAVYGLKHGRDREQLDASAKRGRR